jgi:hypothetical protein
LYRKTLGKLLEKEIPMLENLLEYYRKSDGAAEKKFPKNKRSVLTSCASGYPERTKVAT